MSGQDALNIQRGEHISDSLLDIVIIGVIGIPSAPRGGLTMLDVTVVQLSLLMLGLIYILDRPFLQGRPKPFSRNP